MLDYILAYALIAALSLFMAVWLLSSRNHHRLNAVLAAGFIGIAALAVCNLCGTIGVQ